MLSYLFLSFAKKIWKSLSGSRENRMWVELLKRYYKTQNFEEVSITPRSIGKNNASYREVI